jgi:hypothetical protein
MRGLKQDRNAAVIIAGHAFVQNVRRGHYELAAEEPANRRLAAAFGELASASDPLRNSRRQRALGRRNATAPPVLLVHRDLAPVAEKPEQRRRELSPGKSRSAQPVTSSTSRP